MILSGKDVAEKIYKEIEIGIMRNLEKGLQDREPRLVIINCSDDPASEVYMKNKLKVAEKVGIDVQKIQLPLDITPEDFTEYVDSLNEEPSVDGIIIQLPIMDHLKHLPLESMVSPDKDCDGFHPMSKFKSCTPYGVMKMLEHYNVPIEGKNAVVIGRSNIVGKPMAQYLVDANATVTVCHSRTPEEEIVNHVHNADIVVVAVGKPEFVKNEDVFKHKATVIDVGIHRHPEGGLCGDVAKNMPESRPDLSISAVPGGVGPMTVCMLMYNTYEAWAIKESKGE